MIMGVLNVTPDSFSDGGEFFATESCGRARPDDDGRTAPTSSTSVANRPGLERSRFRLTRKSRRVVPVIERLAQAVAGSLSIDTSKADVARAALDAGATIINDVTGGRGDSGMFALAAEKGAALIIMHMQGTPRTMQANSELRGRRGGSG